MLLELSGAAGVSGGVDAQGRPTRNPADVLSDWWQQEIRKHALLTNELLRHFWVCIPANSEAKREKVSRVKVRCAAGGEAYCWVVLLFSHGPTNNKYTVVYECEGSPKIWFQDAFGVPIICVVPVELVVKSLVVHWW